MKEKDKIILCGDLHGKWRYLSQIIERLKLTDSYIIQVGDFGIGMLDDIHSSMEYYKYGITNYDKQRLKLLNNQFQETNNYLYAIRGNHDNPKYFDLDNPHNNHSNIKLLPDFTELNLLGKKILLVGGAISIDRNDLKLNIDYWESEKFKLQEDFTYNKYDLVVTHSRPGYFGSYVQSDFYKYCIKRDRQLIPDLEAEKQLLNQLFDRTRPADWIYGHFHASVKGVYENTNYRCLDINELIQYY